MNLKESYRYANYLDTLLNTAYRYLQNKGLLLQPNRITCVQKQIAKPVMK